MCACFSPVPTCYVIFRRKTSLSAFVDYIITGSDPHYLKGNPRTHLTHTWGFTGCFYGRICMSINRDITHNSTLNTILFIPLCKYCSLRFLTNHWNSFLIPFFCVSFCFELVSFAPLLTFQKPAKIPKCSCFDGLVIMGS